MNGDAGAVLPKKKSDKKQKNYSKQKLQNASYSNASLYAWPTNYRVQKKTAICKQISFLW